MKKLKRPLSIILSIMMVVSLFAVVPITASAAEETSTVTWNSFPGDGGMSSGGVTLTTTQTNTRSGNIFYNSGSATFTAPEGSVFTKIELKKARYVANLNFPGATVAEDGGYWRTEPWDEDEREWVSYYTVTWTGESSEVTFSGAVSGIESIVFTLKSTAAELPEAIKDCTYHTTDSTIYANVPFEPDDASGYSSLVDGAISALFQSGTIQVIDAKGYSYKFYDQTGTEIAATLSNSAEIPGSRVGLTDRVTVYRKLIDFTLPENFEKLYIVATEPEPATEAPTEVPTEAPTTITVKFVDALGWGDIHFYYWGSDVNGPEWPGNPMTKAEVNDYGEQVYTAEIPAGVDGVIFNGNGKQTVDITEGIADGTLWYSIAEKEGTGYKVGRVDAPTEPASQPTSEPATEPTTEPAVDYTNLIPTGSEDSSALTALQVTFNGKPWYIIEDDSTALTAGTVTLLAADTSFGLEQFSTNAGSNNYSNSTVKSKLDSYTASGGDFENVADAIVDTNLQDVSVTGAKLYLLSKDEASALPVNVRQLSFSGAEEGAWWLRNPAQMIMGVFGTAWVVMGNNSFNDYTVTTSIGVRPALKLDLSKVEFNSTTNTFALPGSVPATYTVTWKNWDGSVIKTDENVAKGTMPEYNGETPVKDEDETNTYTFSGWSPEVTEVTGDAEYTATFTAENKAVKNVIALIKALPEQNEVTLAHEEQIMAARAAYNALSYDEKDLVSGEVYDILCGAETALNSLKRDAFSQYRGGQADSFYIAMDQKIGSGEAELMTALQEAMSAIQNVNYDPDKSLAENKAAVDAAVQAQTEGMNNKMTEACNTYKAQKTADVQGLAQNGDPDPVYTVIQVMADRINGETFENQTVSQFKSRIDTIVEQAQEQISFAREEAFNNYKNEKAYDVQSLAQAGDSAAVIQILDNAVQAIDAVSYDTSKTYVENQAAVDAAVDIEQLTHALDAQRNADKAAAVTAQINALPAEITLNDKADVEAARQAFEALTDEQKALVAPDTLDKLTDAETVIADREAAKVVEDQINALPAEITLADKADVEAARQAFEALTDDQKAYVATETLDKLADAETVIADREAAKAVTDQINALPADPTLNDKAAVEAARQAFEALTDDQKAYVATETLDKLADAETVIADREAAKAVEDIINALPDKVTPENTQTFKDAASAYTGLTYAQADYIPQETQNKVLNAFGAVFIVEGVENIRDDVTLDNVTLEDKALVENYSAFYDGMSDDVKAFVNDATVEKLNAAKKTIPDLYAAKTVIDQINAIPEDISSAQKEQIEAARAAYEALTDDQKALIDGEIVEKLAADEAALKEAIDHESAEAVMDMIDALPAAGKVKLADKEAIEAARAAYEALTDEQKALVPAEFEVKLTVAEAVLAVLEKSAEDEAAAATVNEMINNLPTSANVTVEDQANIEAAKAAYDALTADQKSLVPLRNKVKLMLDSAALTAAVKAAEDKAAADAVSDMINALPAAADVTLGDKEDIEAAKAAYDALTSDQKKLILLANRIKLAELVGTLAGLEDEAAAAAVEDMIRALPAAEDITLDDKAAVEEAAAALDALTADQKKFVTLADKLALREAQAAIEQIENDMAAADAVAEQINALPAAEEITLDDEPVISDARKAYDALTDAQKAYVDDETVQKLTDAEQALEDYIKECTTVAQAISNMIRELPSATRVTLNDKEAIEKAAAAYDTLTDDEKSFVPLADKLKLAAAKGALDAAEKFAEDEAAAAAVKELIRALPAAEDITLDDKAAVEEAAAALDALTANQKKLVPLADKLALNEAQAAIEKIENDMAAAEAVTELINALPAAEDVVLESAYDINGARAAYNALTEDQKALVDDETVKKLTDAEDALAAAVEVDIVDRMLNELPAAEDVTLNDKAAIEEARAAYDALSDAQKALIDDETVQKLTDAEEALAVVEADKAAAEAVEEMIEALPAATKVTVNDKEAIEEAAAAYDALTDAQKEYVSLADKVKLAAVKGALDAAEKFAEDEAAAAAVKELIRALPAAEDVTLDDKAAIEEAAAALDALTPAQKKLVPLADKLALREAQAAIEKIEKDMAAADAVTDKINALPAAEDVTLDDAKAIMDAIAAYQLLTDDQKAYVDDETVEKLNAVEDALIQAAKDAIAAEAVKLQINALPDVEDLTYDDKDDVEAARAAYDALTDAQKALIDEDTYKKLTDAEARMNRFVLLGDANGDGRINIKDITAIQRHLAEITLLDELGELAADVNRDGNVTIEDVSALQSYLAEYEVEYPIGEMV